MNDARLSARSECYGTALRKASRRVTALYDETLAPSGLRSTQFAILAEIVDRDEGPPTLNQLADDLVLDRSGLGHSLRPLEREGLIRLEKSSRDRRSTLVTITDHGQERYAYAFKLWQKAQDRYASVVGETQANELRQRLFEIGHDDQLTQRHDSGRANTTETNMLLYR